MHRIGGSYVLVIIILLNVQLKMPTDSLCQDSSKNLSSIHDKLNRTKRANTAEKVLPWRKIYSFTKKFSKIAGNNALLAKLNNMITNKAGGVSKSNIYGYGYGGGCGGGYGGYSYAAQPIVYYVPVQTQSTFPINNINGFTGGFGNTVSDQDLLEQLISLIQIALDDSGSGT